MTILYAVSPIGLGHASRAAAIGSQLASRGFAVEFATGPPATTFLSSYGFKVHDIIRAPLPILRGGRVMLSSLWYAKYWLSYRSSKSRLLRLLETTRAPELVVGDEEFSSVSLALERGLKHALITDERELGFARGYLAKKVELRVMAWYAKLQEDVSCLIVPGFGRDDGNVHFVTPVVREVTAGRDETRTMNGIPVGSRVILVSLSGSGIGRYLVEAAISAFAEMKVQNAVLVVVGERRGRERYEGNVIHLGFVRDNQNLIAAADVVVSLAGKSTIDEAASSGTPVIAIPLRNHFEQERNASDLGFSYQDIGRLGPLIFERLGKPREPKNYHGSLAASDLLARIARGSS